MSSIARLGSVSDVDQVSNNCLESTGGENYVAFHTLESTGETLHGRFSRDLPPVLTIDPGDTVRFQTLDSGWGLEAPHTDLTPRRTFPHDPAIDSGHALCGPLAVRGARPGMTLVVEIGQMVPGEWGYTNAARYPNEITRRLGITGSGTVHVWRFDEWRSIATNQHGHTVPLRPFMGVMGVAPPETGDHPTPPPRIWGGNIDCRHLVAGSTLYLPVGVDGALFSTGDGHGTQGDGEVSGNGIECPMDRVDLRFDLSKQRLNSPRARTPDGWLTFGFHEDLNEAMLMALNSMLDLIEDRHRLSRADALAICSVMVDFSVTQIVNHTRGVHALLPHKALPSA